MKFAKNIKGNLTTVIKSGQICFCPLCNEEVIGKIYIDRTNHFAHKPNPNCKYQKGDISDWHLNWQYKFKKNEIRYPDLGLRADAVLENKTVIEFQNSSISLVDLKKRENGYKRMVWLFNLTNYDNDRVFINSKNIFYWSYCKKTWILPTKPFFFHLKNNKIIQLREPEIYYEENKGGYQIPSVKAKIWNNYSIDEFINMLYKLDKIENQDFGILENLTI